MSIDDMTKLYDYIINNNDVYDVLKEDIYLNDSYISKLEKLDAIKDKKSTEYKELYNDIISVGEYPINSQV
jgi:hypothetical protein